MAGAERKAADAMTVGLRPALLLRVKNLHQCNTQIIITSGTMMAP